MPNVLPLLRIQLVKKIRFTAMRRRRKRRDILRSPPLTYCFSLMMDAEQSFLVHKDMDIPIPKTVHGEQSFNYHAAMFAGDTITGRQRIADMFEKKGGALQFIVTETRMDNQDGAHICDLKTSIVILNI